MKEEKLYALVDQELRGELPREDRSQLDQWLGQDSANRNAYEEARSILALTGQHIEKIDPDTDAQWEQLMGQIGNETEEETTPVVDLKGRSRSRRVWSIAASIVLLAIVGYFLIPKTGSTGTNPNFAEISTERKENRSYKLPDGSEVTLNAGSRLSYNTAEFNQKDRKVTLEGEAYFDIARDESKPFIITSGGAETTVLGTSFNICAYPEQEDVRIDVTSGRVQFKSISAGKARVLVAHEAAICMKNGLLAEVDPADVTEAEWRQGDLVFRKTALKDAVVILEKHYDLDFDLSPDVADMPLNTTYNVSDFSAEKVLDNLELTLGVNIDAKDGGQVYISK